MFALFLKAYRDLTKRRVRSLLTLGAIAIGVAGIVAIVSTAQNLTVAQSAAYHNASQADITFWVWDAPPATERALAELAGLTRQLGYGADVVVACCDAAVRDVRKVFGAGQVELYGGGGTDLDVGLRAFIERTHDPIDLLVMVSDCHTTWSNDVPPFPVITIRVGDGAPPPWGNRRGNTVISIEDRRG